MNLILFDSFILHVSLLVLDTILAEAYLENRERSNWRRVIEVFYKKKSDPEFVISGILWHAV